KNDYIQKLIKKDDPIEVKVGDKWGNYYIVHNGSYIGRLSSHSAIQSRAKDDDIRSLGNFFVSNVFIWTYDDTLIADERAQEEYQRNPAKYKYKQPKRYALDWSDDAKRKQYIYIVQIAGFGTKI
ncbi:hypothetical protein VPJ68_03935, partial [Parabacteroides distasonis]